MPVRLATADDIPALIRVINRAYVVEAHLFHGNRTDEAEVRERFARPNACFLAIDAPERAPSDFTLAATVFVELGGDRSYFGMLSVDPDWQGRGFARELITAAEARGAAAGCAFMDIDVVDRRTELPAFYTKFGYVPVGATPYSSAAAKVPIQMIRMTKRLDRRHSERSEESRSSR
jgi:GNAT superfamily N-acetyltransferase